MRVEDVTHTVVEAALDAMFGRQWRDAPKETRANVRRDMRKALIAAVRRSQRERAEDIATV